MPYADFQPSTDATRVNRQILDNVDFGTSMMERAARHASLLQDIEHRKQRFVQDTLLSDQQIQENRLTLARLEGEQGVNAARNRTAVALADQRYTELQSNIQRLGQAATELPMWLRRVEEAQTDAEMQDIAGQFHNRFGHLIEDPAVSQQYAGVEGPLASLVRSRQTAYQARVQAAAESLLPALDASTPEKLAQIEQSPLLPMALKHPLFLRTYETAKTESLRRASPPPVPTPPPASNSPADPAAPTPPAALTRPATSLQTAAPTTLPALTPPTVDDLPTNAAPPPVPASPPPATLPGDTPTPTEDGNGADAPNRSDPNHPTAPGIVVARSIYDGKKERSVMAPFSYDKESLQKNATEWTPVTSANRPQDWATFSIFKGLALMRGGELLGLAKALSAPAGVAVSSLASDSFALEFRITGESLVKRDWFGKTETHLTWSGLKTVVDYDRSGPERRELVGGQIEYRINFLDGRGSIELPSTSIPGLPGADHYLKNNIGFPLHDAVLP